MNEYVRGYVVETYPHPKVGNMLDGERSFTYT